MADFGKALSKGLDILEALVAVRKPLAFSELRDSVAIPPASFARFLKLLCERGYVMQNEAGRYMIGWRSIQLGLAGIAAAAVVPAAAPHLAEITRLTQESAELALFDDRHFIFLAREECLRSVVLAARTGSRFEISDHTAIGRVGMAFGRQGRGAAVPAPELARIRAEQYADQLQNNNEVFRGAAALFDQAGTCIGVITVAAPAFRVGAKEKTAFKRLLREHAAQISAKLGFHGTGNGQLGAKRPGNG